MPNIQKAKGDLKKLHEYMRELFTDSYGEILISAARILYPKFDAICDETMLTHKEQIVVSLHLLEFQNKITREFLQVDRDHTVTNIKQRIAETLFGKGGSLNTLKELD